MQLAINAYIDPGLLIHPREVIVFEKEELTFKVHSSMREWG